MLSRSYIIYILNDGKLEEPTYYGGSIFPDFNTREEAEEALIKSDYWGRCIILEVVQLSK